MQVASVSQQASAAAMQRTSEAKEAPGPDHDGDKDDRVSAAKSTPAKDVGSRVDVSA